MATEDLQALRRLQALMDITRLVGGEESIESVLDAIAHVLAETVGFAGVVINVYRPQWDDYEAATVVGRPAMRERLLGQAYDAAWIGAILDERFERRGAYFIPDGAFDWEAADIGARWVPEPSIPSDDGAWRPGDELFVPCRHSDGHILAVISLGEPVSGRRASEPELDFLVAVGRHAGLVLEQAQRAREAARHRAALEQLLAVSSKLAEKVSIDSVLQAVCDGVREALGFQKVLIELGDATGQVLTPRACVGWEPGREPCWEVSVRETRGLLDPAFEIGGCQLLPHAEGRARGSAGYIGLRSRRNGRGPRAWNRHWLFAPLRDASGATLGRIWADEPEDRLLPSREHLEALALFAGQATMAIVSAGQLERLRLLADEDPLTGLPNRRAFMRELDDEVARARRYGHPLTLVIGDVDRFKSINDTHGHPAGDAALCAVAAAMRAGLRGSDRAYRIGGDEFALLLPETTGGEADAVLDRLTAIFRADAPALHADLRVSCGFATLPGEADDAQALIRRADAALYAAKRAREAAGEADRPEGPAPAAA